MITHKVHNAIIHHFTHDGYDPECFDSLDCQVWYNVNRVLNDDDFEWFSRYIEPVRHAVCICGKTKTISHVKIEFTRKYLEENGAEFLEFNPCLKKCAKCRNTDHHWKLIIHDPNYPMSPYINHPAAIAGHTTWMACVHCDAWKLVWRR